MGDRVGEVGGIGRLDAAVKNRDMVHQGGYYIDL